MAVPIVVDTSQMIRAARGPDPSIRMRGTEMLGSGIARGIEQVGQGVASRLDKNREERLIKEKREYEKELLDEQRAYDYQRSEMDYIQRRGDVLEDRQHAEARADKLRREGRRYDEGRYDQERLDKARDVQLGLLGQASGLGLIEPATGELVPDPAVDTALTQYQSFLDQAYSEAEAANLSGDPSRISAAEDAVRAAQADFEGIVGKTQPPLDVVGLDEMRGSNIRDLQASSGYLQSIIEQAKQEAVEDADFESWKRKAEAKSALDPDVRAGKIPEYLQKPVIEGVSFYKNQALSMLDRLSDPTIRDEVGRLDTFWNKILLFTDKMGFGYDEQEVQKIMDAQGLRDETQLFVFEMLKMMQGSRPSDYDMKKYDEVLNVVKNMANPRVGFNWIKQISDRTLGKAGDYAKFAHQITRNDSLLLYLEDEKVSINDKIKELEGRFGSSKEDDDLFDAQ